MSSMEVSNVKRRPMARDDLVVDPTRIKSKLSLVEQKAAENESINEIIKKLRMLSTSDRKLVTDQLSASVAARVKQVSRFKKSFHDECMINPTDALSEATVILEKRQGKVFIQMMKNIVSTMMSERYKDGLKLSNLSVIYVITCLYLFAKKSRIIKMSNGELYRYLARTGPNVPDDLGKLLSGTCFKSEKKITKEQLDRQFSQASVDTKMKLHILKVKHKTLVAKYDKAKRRYDDLRDEQDKTESDDMLKAKDDMAQYKSEIIKMEQDIKHHDVNQEAWDKMKKEQYERISKGKMRGIMSDFNRRVKSWHDNVQLYLPVTGFSRYYDDYQKSVIREWVLTLLYDSIYVKKIMSFEYFVNIAIKASASYIAWRYREISYNESKDLAIIENNNRDDCGPPKMWQERIDGTKEKFVYIMEYVLKKIPRGEAKLPTI